MELSEEGKELSAKYNGLHPVRTWMGDVTGATEFSDGTVVYWHEGRDPYLDIEYADGRIDSVDSGPYYEFAEIGESGESIPKIKIVKSIEGDCHGIFVAADGARLYWREGRGHEIPVVVNLDGTRGKHYKYEEAEDFLEGDEFEYSEMSEADEAEWEEYAE